MTALLNDISLEQLYKHLFKVIKVMDHTQNNYRQLFLTVTEKCIQFQKVTEMQLFLVHRFTKNKSDKGDIYSISNMEKHVYLLWSELE